MPSFPNILYHIYLTYFCKIFAAFGKENLTRAFLDDAPNLGNNVLNTQKQ